MHQTGPRREAGHARLLTPPRPPGATACWPSKWGLRAARCRGRISHTPGCLSQKATFVSGRTDPRRPSVRTVAKQVALSRGVTARREYDPRHDPMGPALTRPSRYITASVLPLGAVRRDRQRHLPVTRRAGTLCTLSRADRRPRRLRGHGEAVWRISWPPAVRDGPAHRGRPCHQAGARGTPLRGSRGSDPVTARSRGRLRGPITVTEWWPGAHMWVILPLIY